MEKNNIPEEVTITPVIRDIERLFNKVFQLLIALFKMLYNSGKSLIKFVRKNLIILMITSIIGAVAGYFSFNIAPKQYASNITIGINVDARLQLNSNIVYFNSLVRKSKHDKLAEIFKISSQEAASITHFSIVPFSSYLENIEMINKLYQQMDTTTHKHISFEDFLTNEESLSKKFTITIKSTDQSIFEKLETPLMDFLENDSALEKTKENIKRILTLKKEMYMQEMKNLDSLKSTINKVLLEQAKSNSNSTNTGGSISLGQNESPIKINLLDIYKEHMSYSYAITDIEKDILNQAKCYQVHSHFNHFGYEISFSKKIRMLIGMFIFFLLTLLSIKVIKQ